MLLRDGLREEQTKLSEMRAWEHISETQAEKPSTDPLLFPFHEDGLPSRSYYQDAASEFRLTAPLLEPLAGKRGLELGGQMGWASYRFVQLGAEMVCVDINPSNRSGLGMGRPYQEAGYRFTRICADAEALPLGDEQFDFVFSCAFLHHLPRPDLALKHVARVLKPKGLYIVSMEAFCPFWSTRAFALSRCPTAHLLAGEGINEQVFYAREYRQWFKKAGLKLDVLNPRWDQIEDGQIHYHRKVTETTYEPELLTNRRQCQDVWGVLARILLKYRLYKIFTKRLPFSLIRSLLLSGSQKKRILLGTKRQGPAGF